MPLVFTEHETYYSGGESEYHFFSFCSSVFASFACGTAVTLQGSPPIFTPISHDLWTLGRFYNCFQFAFLTLVQLAEGPNHYYYC